MTGGRSVALRVLAVLALAVAAGCVGSPAGDSGGSDTGTVVEYGPGTVTADVENGVYVPENDTVRYAAAVGRNDTDYRYVPFEEFADLQCPQAVHDHVVETVEKRVNGTVEYSHGVDDHSVHVWVYRSSPVGVETVRSVLPAGYEFDVTVLGRNHTCRVEVDVGETGQPEPV